MVLVKLLHHLVEQGDQREKTHAAQKNWIRVRSQLIFLLVPHLFFFTFIIIIIILCNFILFLFYSLLSVMLPV